MNTYPGRSRKALFVTALGSLLAVLFFMAQLASAQGTTFKGEIVDEHLNCVQTPMKAIEGVTTKYACVLYWVRYVQQPPSKYVLYDAASKTTYQLDDQARVQPYAGEAVQITGTLDAASKTIKVTGIGKP